MRALAPSLMVVASCVSTWTGAAVAATLFDTAGVMTVLSLRLVFSALLLVVISRPSLRLPRADLLAVVAFGVALAGMNTAIYSAIDRIPLGIAVSLEILGPLGLYVWATRSAAGWALAGLALVGVVLLCGVGTSETLDLVGVVLALTSACCWAAYLVLSARVGRRLDRLNGLALGMVVGALLQLPLALVAYDPTQELDARVVLLGFLVAVLATVVPYALEMLALRRTTTAHVAFLMSLSPAIAALAGLVVLGQRIGGWELVGMTAVICACAAVTRTSKTPAITTGTPAPPASPAPWARTQDQEKRIR